MPIESIRTTARDARLFVAVLLLAGIACRSASTPPPAAPAPRGPATPAATNAAGDPKKDLDSIRWMRDSAEYQAAARQTYRAATSYVEQAAVSRAAGTWAVVLDADETIINNIQYQVEISRVGEAFTPASWKRWVQRREATPVPGARAFLDRVRELGGRIAVVTNRLGSECDDTAAVFTTHLLVYDVMLCRPDGTPSDKNPRFESVAKGTTPMGGEPLDVIAFLGDNILDFPALGQDIRGKDDAAFADFGARFFVLPNPMYGSWQ